jgi:hypothetical protein
LGKLLVFLSQTKCVNGNFRKFVIFTTYYIVPIVVIVKKDKIVNKILLMKGKLESEKENPNYIIIYFSIKYISLLFIINEYMNHYLHLNRRQTGNKLRR